MSQTCKQCKHFREAIYASRHFAIAIDTDAAQVKQAIGQIMENEKRLEGEEARVKLNKARDIDLIEGDARWDKRPAVSAYCGLHESEGVYLIYQFKNIGDRCYRDKLGFEPGSAVGASCNHCTFRMKGRMKGKTARIVGMAIPRPGLGVNSDLSGSIFSGFIAQTSDEIIQAYQSNGILLSEPNFLDYCHLHSREDEYVVCVLRNPHNRCPDWTPRMQVTNQAGEVATAPGEMHAESTVVENDGIFRNCGGYSFYLDNVALSVNVNDPSLLREISDEMHCRYDTRSLPIRRWVTLQDKNGSPLPIHVNNDRGAIRVQVGSPPELSMPQLGIWSNQKQKEQRQGPQIIENPHERHLQGSEQRLQSEYSPFSVEANRWPNHAHPTSEYSFKWYLSPWDNMIQFYHPTPPGGVSRYDVNQFPEGQWIILQYEFGGELPLKICRKGQQLFAQWLP